MGHGFSYNCLASHGARLLNVDSNFPPRYHKKKIHFLFHHELINAEVYAHTSSIYIYIYFYSSIFESFCSSLSLSVKLPNYELMNEKKKMAK